MVSVIIAAHNEAPVIADCLSALAAASQRDDIEVIVSANGCTDSTAAIARGLGATVVERAEPGKSGALNAGETRAISFPRVFLDADIRVPAGGLDVLTARATGPGVVAVVPDRRLALEGRPWAVRAYFAVNERLPVFRNGLFGRGLIVLSEEARARFGEFPEVVADDLFLDAHFTDAEKVRLPDVVVVVEAPMTTAALLARLVRVRRGNAQLRQARAAGAVDAPVRASQRWAWARVVARDLRLVPAAIAYVSLTLRASKRARVGGAIEWGHDTTTRQRTGSTGT